MTGSTQVRSAEGSANHIYLTRIDGTTVSASTVSGVIWFSGPLHADGHYTLATHSGSVEAHRTLCVSHGALDGLRLLLQAPPARHRVTAG